MGYSTLFRVLSDKVSDISGIISVKSCGMISRSLTGCVTLYSLATPWRTVRKRVTTNKYFMNPELLLPIDGTLSNKSSSKN